MNDLLSPKFSGGKSNKDTLDAIQQGIFLLCLDQPMTFDKDTPTDRLSLIAGQMNHGWGSKKNSGNRWFDKTMQVNSMSSMKTCPSVKFYFIKN